MINPTFNRYCPLCGYKLDIIKKTNWNEKTYLLNCIVCKKNYKIQFVLVEYKELI